MGLGGKEAGEGQGARFGHPENHRFPHPSDVYYLVFLSRTQLVLGGRHRDDDFPELLRFHQDLPAGADHIHAIQDGRQHIQCCSKSTHASPPP